MGRFETGINPNILTTTWISQNIKPFLRVQHGRGKKCRQEGEEEREKEKRKVAGTEEGCESQTEMTLQDKMERVSATGREEHEEPVVQTDTDTI